jgi:hypothetical protein
MGRFKTQEEKQRNRMAKNPKRASLAELEAQSKNKAAEPIDPVELLVNTVYDKSRHLVSDYRNTVKHTGSLVSGSMAIAYQQGVNDTLIELIKEFRKTKETKNEEPVQENKIPGTDSPAAQNNG